MNKRQGRIIKILIVVVGLSLIFSGFSVYRMLTLQPGEKTVTTAGITVEKPVNSVVDAKIDDKGILRISYQDGSTREVGYVLGFNGEQGEQGPPPTQAQIALAVANYCGDGRCDAKNPTAEQVATAVSNYCSINNGCRGANGNDGSNGQNGQNATPEQIMTAVTNYCSDGRCKGETGATGATGANGRTTVMSCVIRTTNSLPTQYVAWKYTDENDSAYRDLYKLPTWSEGSSCVDLRGA